MSSRLIAFFYFTADKRGHIIHRFAKVTGLWYSVFCNSFRWIFLPSASLEPTEFAEIIDLAVDGHRYLQTFFFNRSTSAKHEQGEID